MPEKPGKNREQLKEITDRIEAGIRDIFESGDIKALFPRSVWALFYSSTAPASFP